MLKLSGGSGEIMRTALPFVSPRIYSAGVLFEAVLGLWLITGIAPAWSWITSIGFFCLLGYMSFQLGWFGQTSCGCLGKVAVNPWWAFGIDCVAVLALLRFRPSKIADGIKRGIPTIVGASAILAVVFGTLVWWYGSTGSAIAHIHGELISISPEVSDIGAGKRGEFADLTLTLTNYGDGTIRIVGGTSSCSCVTTDDLPLEIPPSENRSINVRVRYTGTAGLFRRRFVLYADTDRLKVVPLTVIGTTLE